MLIEFNNFSNNYELSPIYEYKFSCLINDFFISYFQVKIQLEKKRIKTTQLFLLLIFVVDFKQRNLDLDSIYQKKKKKKKKHFP